MEDLSGGTLALEHRYDVLQRRGRRGFVTMYHGRQDPFDKPVWVKAYDGLADAGADLALFDRLKQAAQTASRLATPGVLRIIDYGELDGRIPFVISERIDGPTLADMLEREGTLSAQATCALIGRLADIVAPAHQAGIAHGSLSPQWIYLPDERVEDAHVGHFQLAVTVGEILATESAVMTPAAVSAFPPEMFEEAAEGEEATDEFGPAADVWAMGVIAYTALVGVHPFFEEELDASEGILRLRNDEARPLDELGIDEAISAVIAQALSKDPARRFASVGEFARRLRQAENPGEAPADENAATAADHSDDKVPSREPGKADSPAAPASSRSTSGLVQIQEREPGPSDRLLTVAIVLLVLSNLAWLFYVTADGADSAQSTTSSNKSAPSSVVSNE